GTLTLPPIKLRWWDTEHQQWQLAELKGETLKVESARAAGKESALRGSTGNTPWNFAIGLLVLLIIGALGWFARRPLRQSAHWLHHRWQRFWQPVLLPELAPVERKKR
ncbi:oxygen tolerance domain protein, partial [Enterobacter ludwigii]